MIDKATQQTSSGHVGAFTIGRLKGKRGGEALFWAFIFAIGFITVWPQEWAHDLEPTKLWFEAHPLLFGPVLTAWGTGLGWLLILFVPIVFRSIAAQFATLFWWAKAIGVGALIFDAMTDWAKAGESFADWPQPSFQASPDMFALYWLARLGWAALCTSGWELLCIACLVGFFTCLINSIKPAKASKPSKPTS